MLPLGANAQSTQTITVTWPSTPLTDKNFINSNPFADFNPSLGTLTTYSLTVSGSGTSTDDIVDIGPPELVFEAPGSTDALVVHTAATSLVLARAAALTIPPPFRPLLAPARASSFLQTSASRLARLQ